MFHQRSVAHTHTWRWRHDTKHRSWFCAIICILSSYFTLFSSLLLLLSFLASNCLTIVLRRLAIRSVHAVRKFSISFSIHSAEQKWTRRKNRDKKRNTHHSLLSICECRTHTQKLHSYWILPAKRGIGCLLYAFDPSCSSFCGVLHLMIHDDDDTMLWNYDEKSQSTFVRRAEYRILAQ